MKLNSSLSWICSQCDTDSSESVGSVQTESVCGSTCDSADSKLLEKWVGAYKAIKLEKVVLGPSPRVNYYYYYRKHVCTRQSINLSQIPIYRHLRKTDTSSKNTLTKDGRAGGGGEGGWVVGRH